VGFTETESFVVLLVLNVQLNSFFWLACFHQHLDVFISEPSFFSNSIFQCFRIIVRLGTQEFRQNLLDRINFLRIRISLWLEGLLLPGVFAVERVDQRDTELSEVLFRGVRDVTQFVQVFLLESQL